VVGIRLHFSFRFKEAERVFESGFRGEIQKRGMIKSFGMFSHSQAGQKERFHHGRR
jgi:hypothetical protein